DGVAHRALVVRVARQAGYRYALEASGAGQLKHMTQRMLPAMGRASMLQKHQISKEWPLVTPTFVQRMGNLRQILFGRPDLLIRNDIPRNRGDLHEWCQARAGRCIDLAQRTALPLPGLQDWNIVLVIKHLWLAELAVTGGPSWPPLLTVI